MVDPYREEIKNRFRSALLSLFGEPLPQLVWNQPPKVQLGDLASPVAFELAKRVKKAPAEIARELIGAAEPLPGVRRAEVAGMYITQPLERDQWLDLLMSELVSTAFPSDRFTFIYDYPAEQAALARIRIGMVPSIVRSPASLHSEMALSTRSSGDLSRMCSPLSQISFFSSKTESFVSMPSTEKASRSSSRGKTSRPSPGAHPSNARKLKSASGR